MPKQRTCRSCGKPLSPGAAVCRYCAAPQTFFRRHISAINLTTALLLILLSGLQSMMQHEMDSQQAERELLASIIAKTTQRYQMAPFTAMHRRETRATMDRFAVGEVTKTDVAQAQEKLFEAAFAELQVTQQIAGDVNRLSAAWRRVFEASMPVNWRQVVTPKGGR